MYKFKNVAGQPAYLIGGATPSALAKPRHNDFPRSFIIGPFIFQLPPTSPSSYRIESIQAEGCLVHSLTYYFLQTHILIRIFLS